MAIAPEQTGLDIRRYFTDEHTHPYDAGDVGVA